MTVMKVERDVAASAQKVWAICADPERTVEADLDDIATASQAEPSRLWS